jgi:hypothetical protein
MMKTPDVLLSNWAIELNEGCEHEPTAEALKDGVLTRLHELKANVLRITRGEKLDPTLEARTMHAARLLLYGEDEDYRRLVNKTGTDAIDSDHLTDVEQAIARLIRQLSKLPLPDWRKKLKTLLDDTEC